eukprot:CAMPEP_0114002504 /NCGR_PEP_ID=MMETSP0372-20130328/1485_1 /TAXON_ID=340204 /ORGANISM="Lankesteria abbotti" /LENGTH=35 /assembly_acc=CAM_ASM_000359
MAPKIGKNLLVIIKNGEEMTVAQDDTIEIMTVPQV